MAELNMSPTLLLSIVLVNPDWDMCHQNFRICPRYVIVTDKNADDSFPTAPPKSYGVTRAC